MIILGALCRAALDTGSPRAAVQSLGVTDEVEIQRFLNFLKRFGCKLISSYIKNVMNLCTS